MKSCLRCKYAKWHVTKSGSLHPSGDGKCIYEYEIPPLPSCKTWLGKPPTPLGGYINRKTELKEHCPYYSEK